jgi:hypothetical protein
MAQLAARQHPEPDPNHPVRAFGITLDVDIEITSGEYDTIHSWTARARISDIVDLHGGPDRRHALYGSSSRIGGCACKRSLRYTLRRLHPWRCWIDRKFEGYPYVVRAVVATCW